MAYLDYVGLAYFKSLLDENYLRTDYSGDTTIQGNVTFTEPVDADVKNDYLGNQIDKTYIKDIILDPEGSGALALVLGDGSVSHLLTNTTVSQVRSSANELYPVLLCYDANAEEAQITKTVKYVHDVQINPSTGYISAKGMYVKHPTFNRRNGVTQKVEWAYDFTDGVTGLGNPMSQVYAYVDPAAQGGEHCIELRLYGNPNVSPVVPSINDSTNTFSIGVGVTGGNVQFGYCPSTPLYLDNGSTLRTEATGHGTDIITRDWLNLNGSLTGLVHTTMNETIDGAKTFKKTVTINSGDNNNKAGLYVQGNSDIHGNEHVYGTETVDGKLTANGTAEIKGGSGNNPSLLVTGNETVTGKLTGIGTAEFSGGSGNTPTLTVNGNESVTGNESVGGNETVGGNISTTNGNISTTNGTISGKTGSIGSGGLTVAGTTTSTGKITGNGGAEISGGSGLKVNGNETVTGTTTVTGKVTANGGIEVSGGNGLVVNGNETVNGEIYKVVNNTPQEYVSYVTNKQETKTTIVNNLIKDKGGLAVDSNKNIYVSLKSGGGVKLNSSGQLYVDFSIDSGASAEAQAAANAMKEQILSTLGMQIPLTGNKTFYVNKDHASATNTWRNSQGVIDKTVGTQDKPFKSISAAISCATEGYAVGAYHITIVITKSSDAGYNESISLPQFTHTTGYILLKSADTSSPSNYAVITNKETSDHAERINSGLCYCTGSGWRIQQLGFDQICRDPNNGVDNFPSLINSDDVGLVTIYACTFKSEYVGDAPSSGHVYMRLIAVYGGSAVWFSQVENFQTTINVTKGNSNSCSVFFAERQGQIGFSAANAGEATDAWHFIDLTGTSSYVFTASSHSTILCNGGARYWMGFSGNITGKKCSANTGSSITIHNVGENIGNEAGTCDTDRFCFVSPASLLE